MLTFEMDRIMDQGKRIALLMHNLGYCRDLLRGIQRYVIGGDKRWFLHDDQIDSSTIKVLRQWNPDGIVAFITDPTLGKKIQEFNCPVVNTCSRVDIPDIPLLTFDNAAAGRMAAKHFLERRFENFGFFGHPHSESYSSSERERGFCERLAQEGFKVHILLANYQPRLLVQAKWVSVHRRIRKWLEKIPKPAAIFACNDIPARHIANLCWQMDLKIPEQIAILGVDNDEIECHLARPPLSSIAVPGDRIGYEAAALLDRMLRKKVPARDDAYIFEPTEVITRQSTDIMAVEDDDIRLALGYIRKNINNPFGVDDVAENVCLGRRVLERRFRQLLGRTVLQEIWRARVDVAKKLLRETSLSMPQIAARAGFADAQRLAVVFRKVVDMSPTDYRRKRQSMPYV